MGSRSGFILGSLLALFIVTAGLALLVAGVCSFHLSVSQLAENREKALFLAEGALQQTLAQCHNGMLPNGHEFGLANEVVTFRPYPDRPDATGQVSFDPASAWGYSTNNYDGTRNLGWNNIPVPSGTVHVMARGAYRNEVELVEAFLQIPTFQYTIACDGPITSSGALTVEASSSEIAYLNAVTAGTYAPTTPANVGGNQTLNAGANSLVTGDVVCQGMVTMAAPSSVQGAILVGNPDVPTISVRALDNSASGAANIGPSPTVDPNARTLFLQDDSYSTSGMVINGNLELNNCTLYVGGGGLTVHGFVSGQGVIAVDGPVQIDQGTDLDGISTLCLLSTGNVTLDGAGKYLQGLVYTNGAFTANNITVVGCLIGQGPSSSMTLNNVTVVYAPEAVTQGPVTITVGQISGMVNQVYSPFTPDPAWQGKTLPTLCSIGNGTLPEREASLAAWNSYRSTADGRTYLAQMGVDPNGAMPSPLMWGNAGPGIPLAGGGLLQIGVLFPTTYDPATNQFENNPPPVPLFARILPNGQKIGDSGGSSFFNSDVQAWDLYASNNTVQVDGQTAQDLSAARMYAVIQAANQAAAEELNQYLVPKTGPQHTTPNLTINDPANQFFSMGVPLKIVSWRQR